MAIDSVRCESYRATFAAHMLCGGGGRVLALTTFTTQTVQVWVYTLCGAGLIFYYGKRPNFTRGSGVPTMPTYFRAVASWICSWAVCKWGNAPLTFATPLIGLIEASKSESVS